MSPNKKVIESHIAATDPSKAAEFLADDIEWIEWATESPPREFGRKGRPPSSRILEAMRSATKFSG